ncbi:MAG: hypothetical protein AAFO29_11335 [Actinomycetota bacterium]
MAWIETVPDDRWTGELADHYREAVDPTYGRVDNIIGVHSTNPRSVEAHLKVYGSAMAGTASLRKVERELIALVVSTVNECHY